MEIMWYYRFSTQYWHSFFFYIRAVVSPPSVPRRAGHSRVNEQNKALGQLHKATLSHQHEKRRAPLKPNRCTSSLTLAFPVKNKKLPLSLGLRLVRTRVKTCRERRLLKQYNKITRRMRVKRFETEVRLAWYAMPN